MFNTAASHHFCKNKNLFSDFRPVLSENMTVAVDNIIFPIEGCRKIEVIFNGTLYRLDNVLYFLKLCRNLGDYYQVLVLIKG